MAFTRSKDPHNSWSVATIDEWKDLGYRVLDGAKPSDLKGVPHYSESLVVKIDGSEDHLIQDGRVVQ